MRRGFCLSRLSKEDTTSMESLTTRQSNVGLLVDRMITGGEREVVEWAVVVEDFKVNNTIVESIRESKE